MEVSPLRSFRSRLSSELFLVASAADAAAAAPPPGPGSCHVMLPQKHNHDPNQHQHHHPAVYISHYWACLPPRRPALDHASNHPTT